MLSYLDKESCEKNKHVVNNPKYPHLDKQKLIMPVAADWDQVQEMIINQRIGPVTSKFNRTLQYLFHKMFLAIYVQIHDNKVHLFVPFINMHYRNTWGNQLTLAINGEEVPIKKYLKKKSKILKKRKEPTWYDKSKWNANNCLIGATMPTYISNTRLAIFKDMFETLCKEHTIPDCEFFLNKRDFPMVRKDGKHPYFHLFDSIQNSPQVLDSHKELVPMLGVSSTPLFRDIMIPTEDDWQLATQKVFRSYCKDDHLTPQPEIAWEKTKKTAIFRGAATGCGVTMDKNPRLHLASLSYRWNDDPDKKTLLDAGITKWRTRDKKYMGNPMSFMQPKKLPFPLSKYMSKAEQAQYRYVINVDGNAAAFRLGQELKGNQTVLKVESVFDYQIWYHNLLQPWVHYVPVKADLSDLEEQIRWCRTHDQKAREIAQNATRFYQKHLTMEKQLEYLAQVIRDNVVV